MIPGLIGLASQLIKPVANLIGAKQNAAAQMAMEFAKNAKNSWGKDLVIFVIILPLFQIAVGNIFWAIFGTERWSEAANRTIQQLQMLFEGSGYTYGHILGLVVLAAIGYRVYRGNKREKRIDYEHKKKVKDNGSAFTQSGPPEPKNK